MRNWFIIVHLLIVMFSMALIHENTVLLATSIFGLEILKIFAIVAVGKHVNHICI